MYVDLFVRSNSAKHNLHKIAIFKQTIGNSSNHTVVSQDDQILMASILLSIATTSH